jgi:hypothetical protein
MGTDYDCWKTDEEPVSWDAILSGLQQQRQEGHHAVMRCNSGSGQAGTYEEAALLPLWNGNLNNSLFVAKLSDEVSYPQGSWATRPRNSITLGCL